MTIQGLPKHFDENTKVIVLGTFPSVISRNEKMYYANSQNNFWPIMRDIFGCEIDKEDKLQIHNIGLWDVIGKCAFKGNKKTSSDNLIDWPNSEPNDFNELRKVCPKVVFAFNGHKAHQFFAKYLKQKKDAELQTWLEYHYDNCIILPSTSPANAHLKKEEKLRIWKNKLENIIHAKI